MISLQKSEGKHLKKTQDELRNFNISVETDRNTPNRNIDSFKPTPVDCNTVILIIKKP